MAAQVNPRTILVVSRDTWVVRAMRDDVTS
jgi:hypothetical protein